MAKTNEELIRLREEFRVLSGDPRTPESAWAALQDMTALFVAQQGTPQEKDAARGILRRIEDALLNCYLHNLTTDPHLDDLTVAEPDVHLSSQY